MTIYIMIGAPGSGKSYLANRSGMNVVSTDAIRKELFGSEAITGKPEVFAVAEKRVMAAVKNGEDVVYDATNIVPGHRKRFLKKFSSMPEVRVAAIVMDTPLETCLERNAKRERFVPEKVIRDFCRMMDSQREAIEQEPYDEIIFVKP